MAFCSRVPTKKSPQVFSTRSRNACPIFTDWYQRRSFFVQQPRSSDKKLNKTREREKKGLFFFSPRFENESWPVSRELRSAQQRKGTWKTSNENGSSTELMNLFFSKSIFHCFSGCIDKQVSSRVFLLTVGLSVIAPLLRAQLKEMCT